MTEENQENENITYDLPKLKLLMEGVEDLPWCPKNIPPSVLNPCTQTYKDIENVMFDLHDGGKIKKMIIENGVGDLIPFNASVYLHYSCYVEEKKVPFDSSMIRAQMPKHYQLGGGFLFSGFEIAVKSMKENEVAQFLIHPDYAYGSMGCPPRIPANASVMVIIQVTGFIDCGYVTLLSRNKDIEFLPFSEKIKICQSHNALAVDYYKHGKIKTAFHHFREAQYILDEEARSKIEEDERQTLLRKYFVNQLMCLSHNKYFKPKKLIEIAKRAEKDAPDILHKDPKFHYCVGLAYTHLQEFQAAEKAFKRAQQLLQSVQQLPCLSKAVRQLKETTEEALKQEKTMWRGAFNKLGYSGLPEKSEPESEEIIQARKTICECLSKFLQQDRITYLNLGFGFTKTERRLLRSEASRLGLLYREDLEDYKPRVEIKKCK